MIVTSAYDDDLMQEKIRTTKETQMEETAQAVQETPAEQNVYTFDFRNLYPLYLCSASD